MFVHLHFQRFATSALVLSALGAMLLALTAAGGGPAAI
jgi:hypothetical protein